MNVLSKGSQGRRVKRLYVSHRTVKVLQCYVSGERSRLDPRGRTLAEFERMPVDDLVRIPLFLTTQGSALDPDHFRRAYWTPALEAVGVKLRPHQVRHWYVTMALNDIEGHAKSDEERNVSGPHSER